MRAVFLFSLFLLCIVLVAPTVSAVAIGASPAAFSFELPRGGSAEESFQVSTNSESAMTFSITADEQIQKFVKLSVDSSQTTIDEPARIPFSIFIPKSAKPGIYEGAITAMTSGSGSMEGGVGSVVATGVAVKVAIKVTGETQASPTAPSAENEGADLVTGNFLQIGGSTGGIGLAGLLAILVIIVLIIAAVILALKW